MIEEFEVGEHWNNGVKFYRKRQEMSGNGVLRIRCWICWFCPKCFYRYLWTGPKDKNKVSCTCGSHLIEMTYEIDYISIWEV